MTAPAASYSARQHVSGYTTTHRAIHWLTVLLVFSTVPAGMIMVQEGIARPTQDMLFIYHKNVGVFILLLVLFRIAWRLMNPPPPLPDFVPTIQRRAATLTHFGLYVMLLYMPITGYVRVTTGGFPIEFLDWIGVPPLLPRMPSVEPVAKAMHYWGRFVLIGLIVLHISGALFHALVRRDGVIWRMWPPYRPRSSD